MNAERPSYYKADLEDAYGLAVQVDLSYDEDVDVLSASLENGGGGDWADCVRIDG